MTKGGQPPEKVKERWFPYRGELLLLGLTALFLCCLLGLNALDAGRAVRAVPPPEDAADVRAGDVEAGEEYGGEARNAGKGTPPAASEAEAETGTEKGTGTKTDTGTETETETETETGTDTGTGTGTNTEIGTGPDEASNRGKLNLNTATEEDLKNLPGIGPVLAGRIVDYRTEHGPFPNIEGVMEVSGIGQGKFSAMEPYIFVST